MTKIIFENVGWKSFRLVSYNPHIEILWHVGRDCVMIDIFNNYGFCFSFEEILEHLKGYDHNLRDFEDMINKKFAENILKCL